MENFKEILNNFSEKEIVESLIFNFKRKLAIYKLIDKKMREKYGMDFEQFEKDNLIKKNNFSWEVEKDAIEWEHAISGIKYIENKLKMFKS